MRTIFLLFVILFASTGCATTGGQSQDPTWVRGDEPANIFQASQSVVRISVHGARGSGFVVTKNGHIVTADHVVVRDKDGAVDKTVRYTILFADHSVREAVVFYSEPKNHLLVDAAVLKVLDPPKNLHPLPFGNTSTVRGGDTIYVPSIPYGDTTVIGKGKILSLYALKSVGAGEMFPYVLADVFVQPGSSGAPLLNTRAQVIGIVAGCFAVPSPTRKNQNLCVGNAYMVPANAVLERIGPLLRTQLFAQNKTTQ